VNFTQRLAHRAELALVAFDRFIMLGEALRQNNRTVDAADHFKRRDLVRIAGQLITARRPLLGYQQAGTYQGLQYLGKQRQRYPVPVGYLLGGPGLSLARQMAQRRLILDERLPFPTGIATGEVIETVFSAHRTGMRRILLLVSGIGIAAAVTGRPKAPVSVVWAVAP